MAEYAHILKLTDANVDDYLSDYDYSKVWPLNSWSRIWINDKLTLKYVLSRGGFDKFLPKYYYYTAQNGLRPLMDNDNKGSGVEDFISTLMQVGDFACKPNNGSLSVGFYKLSYHDGDFYINDALSSREEIVAFVSTHPNYIFTEYLRPSKQFAAYGPLIHTVRVVVLNEHGNDPRIAFTYIRLPSNESGVSNKIVRDGTNDNACDFYMNLDLDTGRFYDAVAISASNTTKMKMHPDTGVSMSGVYVEHEKMKNAALSISEYLNNLEWLGFDFGITDAGIKIMEINSHPGMCYCQFYRPLMLDSQLNAYFKRKNTEIDCMSEAEKRQRSLVAR